MESQWQLAGRENRADALVWLWDEQGVLVGTLSGHRGGVNAVDWSPDGEWLVSGGSNFDRLWKPDGTSGPVITGHTDKVESVAWSPNGEWIASGSADTTVQLWKPDGTPGRVLAGHQGRIDDLAWSPDGRFLASGSWLDCTLRIWNIETGDTEWMLVRLDRDPTVTLSPQGVIRYPESDKPLEKFWYLLERRDGSVDILSSTEFYERHAVAHETFARLRGIVDETEDAMPKPRRQLRIFSLSASC